MLPSLPSKPRSSGFTLIELLVVITIVGLLAAMLFPVFSSVQNAGRKTQALADAKNLVTACFAYKSEYNKLPLTEGQRVGGQPPYNFDTVYGDPGDNAYYHGYELIDILRAIADDQNKDHVLNPSRTVYFTAPFVKNPGDPRHGILINEHKEKEGYTMKPGTLVDPWGSEYVVFLDANNDNDLNTAIKWFYPKYQDETGPKASVMVVSMGADGDFGKDQKLDGSDDVVAMQ